MIVVWQCVL